MLGAGLALLGDGAGDDIDGAAFARGPGGIRAERCGGVPMPGLPNASGFGAFFANSTKSPIDFTGIDGGTRRATGVLATIATGANA